MRFTVGDIVPFLDIQFIATNGAALKMGSGSTYKPWTDNLLSIRVLNLTCLEHHKVRDAWDEKDASAQYDGFIFGGESNMRWNNQYPSSNSSQMSTEPDWAVRRIDRSIVPNKLLSMVAASHYLTNIQLGLTQMRESGRVENMAALQHHHAEVEAHLHEAGWTVSVEQLRDNNGVAFYDFFNAVITKREAQAQVQVEVAQ